ncbi:MAG: FecR domain-containing protein [Rhodothermales bacterium]
MDPDENMAEGGGDRDARLARIVGDALDRGELGEALKATGDPLGVLLSGYAERRTAEGTSEAWTEIRDKIAESRRRRPALRLVTSRRIWWAAAASVAIFALISTAVLLRIADDPKLVAATDAGPREVALPDGSTVLLRAHSELHEISKSDARVEYRLIGEGVFRVAKLPSRTFVVDANQARIEVLGTTFVASTWGGTSRVFLEEGRVRFSAGDGSESVELAPGESSALSKDGHMIAPLASNRDAYFDWTENRLVFDNQLASQVADELSQQFDVQIVIPRQSGDVAITGEIGLDSLNESLESLGLVLGGSFRDVGDGVFEYVSK